MIGHLTQKVKEMVLDNDHIWENANGPVKTPGPIDASLAQQPPCGRRLERMLVSFCCLSKSSANTIVVYIGVSMMNKLADSREEHWKNTFIQ